MFTRQGSRQNGQAVVLVTCAMVPMMMILGLVTDLGYMHYIRKAAQAAADSAALAAVYRYNRTISGSTTDCSAASWMCRSGDWSCPSAIVNATNPVEAACVYAKLNGFSNTG